MIASKSTTYVKSSRTCATMNFGTACKGLHTRAIFKFQSPWSVRLRRASTNSVGTMDPHAYCKDLVRKHDYDSFLTSYFYPREAQSGFFAIKAFSVSTPPQ
jgi:NADH dehydrogenase [ubiquinone] 1 alpha subcomplex assembly factor 6